MVSQIIRHMPPAYTAILPSTLRYAPSSSAAHANSFAISRNWSPVSFHVFTMSQRPQHLCGVSRVPMPLSSSFSAIANIPCGHLSSDSVFMISSSFKAAHNPPLKFVPAFGLHGTALKRSPLATR